MFALWTLGHEPSRPLETWRPVNLHHSVQHCGARGGGLGNPAPSITRQLTQLRTHRDGGLPAHSLDEANPPWRTPVSTTRTSNSVRSLGPEPGVTGSSAIWPILDAHRASGDPGIASKGTVYSDRSACSTCICVALGGNTRVWEEVREAVAAASMGASSIGSRVCCRGS